MQGDLNTPSGHSKIILLDGWDNVNAEGYGEVRANVPAGLYTARVLRGGESFERVIRHTGASEELYEEPLRTSAVPTFDTSTAHEYYSYTAAEFSKKATGAADKIFNAGANASRLFIFFRTESRERSNLKDPSQQMTLHRSDGSLVTSFGAGVTARNVSDGWVAFSARVQPGCYLLAHRGNIDRVMPIHVFGRWDSQLFIPSGGTPNLAAASFFLAPRGNGFDPESRLTAAMDAALAGLEGGLDLLPRDLRREALSGKFQNPMLGLIGAYSLFADPSGEQPLRNEVLGNLERLLPDSSDVTALKILSASRFGTAAPDMPVEMPPMFRMGSEAILRAAASKASVVPAGSLLDRFGTKLFGDAVWTQWDASGDPFLAGETHWTFSGSDQRTGASEQPGAEAVNVAGQEASLPDWLLNLIEDETERNSRRQREFNAAKLAAEIGIPERTVRQAVEQVEQSRRNISTTNRSRRAVQAGRAISGRGEGAFMEPAQRYLELLRRKVATIKGTEGPNFESAPPHEAQPETGGLESGHPEVASLEAVILWHRPVLWIRRDEVERNFTFTDPNDRSSPEILKLLEQRRDILTPALPAIGRIELDNNAEYEWVGTGWVLATDLDSDIVVTNAHVGHKFAQRSGAGFVFRRGTRDFGRPQSARIDFREEIEDGPPREFVVTDVIWISDDEVLDIALLRVALKAGEDRLSGPIRLAVEAPAPGRNVAVIGYPGDDSRSYDAEKFVQLFGRVFGKKRLAPGRVTAPHQWGLTHDCSTLPGNSGSVVLDIETGKALGLHYSGSMFRANYAVPATELARIVRERPWKIVAVDTPRPSLLVDPASPAATQSPPGSGSIANAGAVDSGQIGLTSDSSLKIVVPLEISVRLGTPALPGGARQQLGPNGTGAPSTAPVSSNPDPKVVETAAASVRKHLTGDKAILSVKADYLFRDGLVTDDLGVIVGVRPDASVDPATYGLPPKFNGVEIAVEFADPETVVAELMAVSREAFGGRQAGYRRDLGDPRFNLNPVTDQMTITLHVSPEAGWPVLQQFLTQHTYNQFTVGMYHMTAPHVVKAIKDIASRARTRITLTLDRQRADAEFPDDTEGQTKKNDIPESKTLDELEQIAESRFKWAGASLGGQGLFPTAYHIKVAVWSDRSGSTVSDKAFWLSSGNWQSSNQAPIDRPISEIEALTWDDVAAYNREWHAVVEHAGLAHTFRNHLEQDYVDNDEAARTEAFVPELPHILVPLEEAPRRPARFRAFPPKVLSGEIMVQPLLTPDNYPEVVASLIANAQERVLIENQSFSLWTEVNDTPAHFLKIADAVRQQQRAGLDVRIIFRSIRGSEKETIRRLKKFGIKTDPEHLRYFGTCHTKGILIDDGVAILGSQNWTAAGTGPNRDASLVIWNREANAYFAELFEYDWAQVASNRTHAESAFPSPLTIVPAGVETPVPKGYRRVSIAEYLGET
ncbi:phospholipase D-like domain-containing protein [Mesorhizobium onobrychidis]|uniref:Phospholipase D n=1 Tax=Mesorhizobium onobrychidis TaxID=2775404 RepID=A0ABY5R7Q4_9HYPH|nr:phospholipase D-like domain-containing protein [Mesorhizobium onobrychidis]UVC19338.1 trypsin-like peptidase domain-containing protein [Mesorhizobium onobrychidis]